MILIWLFRKWPRAMRYIGTGGLILAGTELTVIALGQLYMQAVNPYSPHLYGFPRALLIVGAFAGPAMQFAGVWLLTGQLRLFRKRRRHADA